MNIRINIFTAFTLILFSSFCYAQSTAETISIEGTVSLDVGVASKDFEVDVTVSNHSFIVLSVSPVTIIRPLLSRVTQSVIIKQGQSSVDFRLNGISTDAVDYVIDFRCDDCGGVFTPQYYTLNGNVFSVSNSTYIDPDDLPINLNFTLTSGTEITGIVYLADGKSAQRNLQFLLSVVDSTDSTNLFRRISIVIPEGANSTDYSIEKLVRETDLVGFDLQLECLNCLTSSILTIDYPGTLDGSINNSNIDFEVEFDTLIFTPPINYLLLDDK